MLLVNFEYLNNDLLNSFKYWPIILIVIGLEILFTKHGSPKLVIASIVIIFILPFFLQGKSLPFNLGVDLNFLNNNINSTGTIPIEKKLGTLIGAKLNLDLNSGDLTIGSLDPMSPLLVQGTLIYSRINKEPLVNFNPTDGTASLQIQSGSRSLPINILASNWKLNLSQAIPISLTAKTNSGKTTLDLTALKLENLNLDLGKTQTIISLGKAGNIKAAVTSLEGTVTITIPKESAAKVEIPNGADFDIPTRFIQTDHGYLTDRFEQAQDKIEININPGKAKVLIN